ncbi:MAG: tRNA uridine-5-carboxymethylaminomethyl(34) synthesis GTPase MnmE [Bacteroidota bacterium]
MKVRTSDTIAAVATPPGIGAIAVIRVSGPGAIALADIVFRGSAPLASAQSHTVHYGKVVDKEERPIDEVLASVFRGPNSYTGEDLVEISCHGGVYVTREVLAALIGAGARQAEPGEFTRRAFMNGKMDLSRAEAVSALIASTSGKAHRASLEQLEGRLSSAVGEVRESMTRLCALLELDLDFSEEGLEIVGRQEVKRKIGELRRCLQEMADSFRTGRIYRDGVSAVIVGRPNAGKSSLFNALLKDARAIVTPIPGTTRDYLEESVTIGDLLVRLTDTAGLTMTDDPVENEGILRSKKSLERADVILLVDDVSKHPDKPPEIPPEVSVAPGQHLFFVRNKTDLLPGKGEKSTTCELSGRRVPEIWVSAATSEGVHVLAETITRELVDSGLQSHESVVIASRRHWESITAAVRSLKSALSSLEKGATNEFVAFDVRESMSHLSEITGEVTSEEVLNSIFSSFCIGK